MKSIKTTIIGYTCFGLAIWAATDNLRREAYALRYWQGVAAFILIGVGFIFARDHSHKDKN